MDIKHGYQPKELLRRRPLEETREDIEAARKAGRESARKDIMELATKLLWLQVPISAIALILSIVALLMKLSQ